MIKGSLLFNIVTFHYGNATFGYFADIIAHYPVVTLKCNTMAINVTNSDI